LPSGPPKPAPPGGTDWTVQPAEKLKYDKLFESLEPVNGLIPGNKVYNFFLKFWRFKFKRLNITLGKLPVVVWLGNVTIFVFAAHFNICGH